MKCIVNDTRTQENILQDSGGKLPPTKVLLRIFGDGYCELYADQHVQVYVQKILAAPGITGELLGIEYADSTLPLSHRGLDDARKLVQTFDTRPVTVSQFITVKESIGALRILDSYVARTAQ